LIKSKSESKRKCYSIKQNDNIKINYINQNKIYILVMLLNWHLFCKKKTDN